MGEPSCCRTKWMLIALCALGLALRLGVIFKTQSYRFNPGAMEHDSIARGLLHGQGFSFGDFGYYGPSSVQSPPYPVLLAGFFTIFGEATPAAYAAAMVFNALVGSLAVWLTYLLARTLGGSIGVGLLAAAACAVWPTQVYASNFVQAIDLIIAAQTAMVVLFYRGVRTGSAWTWAAFSLVATLAALTEPVLLPIAAFTGILILFWRGLALRLRIRNAAILLGMALVVIGPWTVRNRMVHGAWVPIKSTFWVNVWKGANDYATGTDRLKITPEQKKQLEEQLLTADDRHMRQAGADEARQYDMLTPQQRSRLNGHTEIEREKVFQEFATQWISAHPMGYAKLCLIRLGKTLWIDWDNPKSYNVAYVASRAIIVVLSAIGLVLAIRKRWSLLYPVLLIGSCILTYSLTLTAARFSIPFEPFQLCLSALTLNCAYISIRRPAAGGAVAAASSGQGT
ncbi:MAG: glycosyltransferase family 39 protein [Phycisphaerales bacterium]|nr:glycosyltransferase family 39 protein [Phycisphaerales bacterium]